MVYLLMEDSDPLAASGTREAACPGGLSGEANSAKRVAPQGGLEPPTLRLTAGCSAIELLRNTRTQERSEGLLILAKHLSARNNSSVGACEQADAERRPEHDDPDPEGALVDPRQEDGPEQSPQYRAGTEYCRLSPVDVLRK
jgi:hypothetical protein